MYGFPDGANQFAEFYRRGESNRVWNIHRRRACGYDRFDHMTQKLRVSASRILRGKFNIVTQTLCQANGFDSLLKTLLPRNAKLVFQVDVGSRQEYMNTRPRSSL